MRVILQRVTNSSVSVEQQQLAKIDYGALLLVGFGANDTEALLEKAANKIANLRIFPDGNQKFHYSLLDLKAAVLSVSQFTLYADTSKGRRPEFFQALAPDLAQVYFDKFNQCLVQAGIANVQRGEFGAYMQVALINDGPVTIILEF
ncbi:D-tyrosyl-tRNA(Tyr) deacylase [bacterium]|nr:D-tyrosyl-tRNA(Tyr) deacylase [bacterium]